MNQYVTGTVIKELREKTKLTQLQLAEKLGVTDKTVSKWENARGLPDITLLGPIAEAFSISVTELISGNAIHNANVSANMLRSKFYVCPVCGNVIHSMGEAAILCHGIQLIPLEAEPSDDHHISSISGTITCPKRQEHLSRIPRALNWSLNSRSCQRMFLENQKPVR